MTTPTPTEALTFDPKRTDLDSTREKLQHVARSTRQTLEAMVEVGADFARYKAEHRAVYGDRPERGKGFNSWVEATFQVSYKTVERWVLLHENRHRLQEATSLRGALALLQGGDTQSRSDYGHVSIDNTEEAEPKKAKGTPPPGEVFVDIITPEGVVTASRQEAQRKAERKEVEALVAGLGVSEEQAWEYVASKRKPLRPRKVQSLPSGWRRVSIPMTKEHSEAIAEAVSQAVKKTRRKQHRLFEECVVELGLERFRKKYNV